MPVRISGELVKATQIRGPVGDKAACSSYIIRDEDGTEFDVMVISNDLAGRKGEQVDWDVRPSVRKDKSGALRDQVSYFLNSSDRAERVAPSGFDAPTVTTFQLARTLR